jgi:hypothetical protein
VSDELDDLFAEEVEVAPSVAASPRLLQVVISLVVVGLLVGAAVIVVVSGLSSVTGVRGGSAVCGGAASCADLSLDQVRSLTAIDLPADSDVVESSYEQTDHLITMTATVWLPDGAADPFDGTGYGQISSPGVDWPIDDLTVLAFYGATGEQGTLNAEAVFAVDDRVREVVLVQVTRTLD